MAMRRKAQAKREEGEEEAPIHGDILESILSRVPLVDLTSASRVSREWNVAVSSSLRHANRVKPWLIVHLQSTRPPYATTAHAYEPRSGDWFEIHQSPTIKHVSAIQSSHSNLLFMLSPTKLAFSSDPLRLTWHQSFPPPITWRKDPIVALVGNRIIVGGGACDYTDDPIPIEVYDVETGSWSHCNAIPDQLRDCAASTSLSVAVRRAEMFVADKSSGLAFAFETAAKTWRGPFDLRRGEESAFCSVIEFSGDGDLISVEFSGSPENVKAVRLRKFRGDSFEDFETIGEMRKEMVEKLVGETSCVSSLSVVAKGSLVFLLNPSDPSVVIQCELTRGGCTWTSVRNPFVDDRVRIGKRLVIGCADVTFDDLRRATATDAVSFVAVAAVGA